VVYDKIVRELLKKTVEKDLSSIIDSVIQSLFFMVVKVGKTKKKTKAKIC